MAYPQIGDVIEPETVEGERNHDTCWRVVDIRPCRAGEYRLNATALKKRGALRILRAHEGSDLLTHIIVEQVESEEWLEI